MEKDVAPSNNEKGRMQMGAVPNIPSRSFYIFFYIFYFARSSPRHKISGRATESMTVFFFLKKIKDREKTILTLFLVCHIRLPEIEFACYTCAARGHH